MLPWVLVEKNYVFDGPQGEFGLGDLFDGRSQLIVQHFMFAPDWEEGCVGCSFLADHADAARQHLEHHDVTFVAISRAPIAKIEAFRKRMGWQFPWVSSFRNDFNYDFHVSFTQDDAEKNEAYYNYKVGPFQIEDLPGVSVFHRNESGDIFHTYSTYARGDEALIGAYNYLDLTPLGRNENGPRGNLTDWVRHHDRYEDHPAASPCGCAARAMLF